MQTSFSSCYILSRKQPKGGGLALDANGLPDILCFPFSFFFNGTLLLLDLSPFSPWSILERRHASEDELPPFQVNFCFPAGPRLEPAGFGAAADWVMDERFVDGCARTRLVPT